RRERKRDPELERRIDEAWERRLAESVSGTLWDSPVARLVAHGALPDRLALYVGATTFREFVGTNLESADLHESLGDAYFANPLGVSAAIVSRDGAVLLAKRSETVVEARGQWDFPGGTMELAEGASPDPFAAMRDELREEIGLGPEDLEEVTCVALVE